MEKALMRELQKFKFCYTHIWGTVQTFYEEETFYKKRRSIASRGEICSS
jgi:hypothetical protein